MKDSLNILVVDDEYFIRELLKEYITTNTSHKVFTAQDGKEALEIIKREDIDCCFTDISMPGMDGIELSKRIHEYDNTIPVVVMTGYPSVENLCATLKQGISDFLIKPIKLEDIIPTIEKIIKDRELLLENMLLKKSSEKAEELKEINRELEEKIKNLEKVNLILQRLNNITNSSELFNQLVYLTKEIIHGDTANFYILDYKDKEHTLISTTDNMHEYPSLISKQIIEKVLEDNLPIIKKAEDQNCYIGIPIRIRDNTFGVIVGNKKNSKKSFESKDLYFLDLISKQASSMIENIALYENIYDNLLSTLYAFVRLIEARDPYTKKHSSRTTAYAVKISKAMQLSRAEIDCLKVAGYLHDIGKIGIPDSILLKPASLTKEEYEMIKMHPVIADDILSHISMWEKEKGIIRAHHERWDGKGYPDGLAGTDIPLLSRILSVADVYDALTSDRAYRSKMTHEEAVKIITENAGTQFDPEIVEIFLNVFREGESKNLYENEDVLTAL